MQKRDWELLFSEYDLRQVLEAQGRKVPEHIRGVPAQDILGSDQEELTQRIVEHFEVSPIRLDEADISVDSAEAQIDVSHDFNRAIFDRSRPFYIAGLEVTYAVPFTGDPELLKCRPSTFTMNPPRAVIAQTELRFPYDRADRDIAASKRDFDADLLSVRQWVGWLNDQVEEFNRALPPRIRQELTTRRQQLAAGQEQLESLGFKVRSRETEASRSRTSAKTQSASPSDIGGKKPGALAYDVALSYAGEDRAYVQEVATLLRAQGISVFYDGFEEVDMWGKNLADHFSDVYAKSSRFIVMFVSKQYAAKAWPNYERQQAQARAMKQREEYILPARFDDTEVPGLANTVAYADLRQLSPQQLAERIIKKVRGRAPDA